MKNTKDEPLNLALVESFFAVASAGSLSAAADGGRSIATLSRHISALQEQLGLVLFERHRDGLHLSESGTRLLEYAARVVAAKTQFLDAATGQPEDLAGVVRISAGVAVASALLPRILVKLRHVYPEIEIELIASDRAAKLAVGEADLAIRNFRPKQAQLVARKVGRFEIGLFAAASYLRAKGRPSTVADLKSHVLIGAADDDVFYEFLAKQKLPLQRSDFAMRCDNRLTTWSLLCAGLGIGLAPLAAAREQPDLEPVLGDEIRPDFPIWLATTREVRRNARLRAVFDFLARELAG
ncbi:MAG: LysR family transcriptional regulator [Myxococcota bacterium]